MKKLTEKELMAVAKVIVNLAASHDILAREDHPQHIRDRLNWDIAVCRDTVHKMLGLTLTDANDFTRKLGQAISEINRDGAA